MKRTLNHFEACAQVYELLSESVAHNTETKAWRAFKTIWIWNPALKLWQMKEDLDRRNGK